MEENQYTYLKIKEFIFKPIIDTIFQIYDYGLEEYSYSINEKEITLMMTNNSYKIKVVCSFIEPDYFKEGYVQLEMCIILSNKDGEKITELYRDESIVKNSMEIVRLLKNELNNLINAIANDEFHFSKEGIKLNPIDVLEEEVLTNCLMQSSANEETIKKWQTDEVAHLKERFIISPLPDKLRPLVDSALSQWQKIEVKILSKLNTTKEEFLEKFKSARASFINGNNEWQIFIIDVGFAVRMAVKNLDWVNLFAWILPRADKENAQTYKETGLMMTAVFYSELLFKNLSIPQNKDNLRRVDARWILVNEL